MTFSRLTSATCIAFTGMAFQATGVDADVVSYDWRVTPVATVFDGVPANSLGISNRPAHEAAIDVQLGQEVEVRVTNELDEPTCLHWHGLRQLGTQEMDGVPEITQCNIDPNRTVTYRFTPPLWPTTTSYIVLERSVGHKKVTTSTTGISCQVSAVPASRKPIATSDNAGNLHARAAAAERLAGPRGRGGRRSPLHGRRRRREQELQRLRHRTGGAHTVGAHQQGQGEQLSRGRRRRKRRKRRGELNTVSSGRKIHARGGRCSSLNLPLRSSLSEFETASGVVDGRGVGIFGGQRLVWCKAHFDFQRAAGEAELGDGALDARGRRRKSHVVAHAVEGEAAAVCGPGGPACLAEQCPCFTADPGLSLIDLLNFGVNSAWVHLSLALEKAQSENGGLTNGALKRLLNDCRVPISDVDARALVQRLSQGAAEDGRVSTDAIKNLIFGALSGRKLEFVQSGFDTLDRKGVGYLALQDILAAHDAARHPAVMFGEQTAEQAAREFQTAFMTAARRTGTAFVSWAQWLTYFQCVAAQAPSDEYFELLMKRVWHADTRCSLQEAAGGADLNYRMDSVPPPAPATVASVSLLQALQQNQSTSNKAKVVLSISTTAPPLGQNRSNSFNFSPMDPDASPRGTAVHTTNEFLKGSQFAACLTEVTSPVSPVSSVHSGVGPSVETLDPGAASVLRKLQSGLRGRGIQALVELGRCLRLGDADGDSMLSLGEFRRALQKSYEATSATTQNYTPLSDADLRGLFRHLDCDRTGTVPVDSALDLVRGTMSSRRLRLVHSAYQTLARETGAAMLDACDVVQRYDASRHPDVIAQRKSEEQCFREFVENFDMDESGGEGTSGAPGKILPRQWEGYYHNVSFLVADDDLFELVVRNTWQLPSTRSPAQPASKRHAPPPILTDSPRGTIPAGNGVRQPTPTSGFFDPPT
ncbi:hypothetical protein ON010_g15546 [Phytophthora cinnamomi]|nr:hypothetical protein ON010_g15546 [Phytophthora cinnamomi]